MAVNQLQVTIPSNGAQAVIVPQIFANANQISIRNTGSINVLIGPQDIISPPGNLAGTPGGGGSLSATTYYWVVTATNSFGETTGSAEFSTAVSASGSCALTWNAVTGATGYQVYRSTTKRGESTSPALVASPTTNSYNDTGTGLSSGAVPATNTASLPALFPLNAGEYLGITTNVSEGMVAQVAATGAAGQITVLGVG